MTPRIVVLLVLMAVVLASAACDDLPTAPSARPDAFRNTLTYVPPPPPF
jgi:hypothetical protein